MVTAGVDLWLNTPRRPKEASGTSGMKAAHNGVPQFSTLDGWWIEGCIENITGWSIGPKQTEDKESDDEAEVQISKIVCERIGGVGSNTASY